MNHKKIVIPVTTGQRRTLAALGDELRRSVKESQVALRMALAEVQATVIQLGKRRRERKTA